MTPSEVTNILRQFNEWRRGDEDIPQFDPRDIGEAVDAAVEMIERMRNVEVALRAEIETTERQEPYSYIYEYSNPIDGSPVWRDKPGYWNAQFPKSSKPLYLAPGAQPAPSTPEGWKLVPIEVIDLYSFMCAAFVPMTPQQEQIALQLDLAKSAMLAAPGAK